MGITVIITTIRMTVKKLTSIWLLLFIKYYVKCFTVTISCNCPHNHEVDTVISIL